VNLLNATEMPAAWTMGVDPLGREHVVVVVKGTFCNCSTALEDRGAAENCINRLIGVGAMSRGCADN
jgi:hypothetical protein